MVGSVLRAPTGIARWLSLAGRRAMFTPCGINWFVPKLRKAQLTEYEARTNTEIVSERHAVRLYFVCTIMVYGILKLVPALNHRQRIII